MEEIVTQKTIQTGRRLPKGIKDGTPLRYSLI